MSERAGLHSVLSGSRIYSAVQSGIVRPDMPDRLRAQFFPELGTTFTDVLDVGCGPATFLAQHESTGKLSYTGFDPNPRYIAKARARFPSAELHVGTVGTLQHTIDGFFDLVVAQGVLHHLDDAEVKRVAAFASTHLRPGGRLVTIDPVLVPGQHPVAKLLARADRGKHVRTCEEYASLLGEPFRPRAVSGVVVSGLLRVPYNHAVCVAEVA